MSFLDDPAVDIYISTWDKTIYESPKIKLYVAEDVTEDRITNDLGRHATILISKHSRVYSRYNCKMIDRWKSGFDLIEKSNIKYDFIIVMRPDLYFMDSLVINDIEKYNDTIGFAWASSMHLSKLPDVIFASTYDNIKKLFLKLSISTWATSEIYDWHVWWHNYVVSMSTVSDSSELGKFTFCRYWVNDNHTFTDAVSVQDDWRDLRLLAECDRLGREGINWWRKDIIDNAIARWQAGCFDKYMHESSNI
jgi:hypothetical protein